MHHMPAAVPADGLLARLAIAMRLVWQHRFLCEAA
jgi:hypothetical protein